MHPCRFRRPVARTVAACCLVTLALAAPRPGLAAEEAPEAAPDSSEMMADMLVHRPLGLARTLLGTGIFIVSLPFTMLSGDLGDAGEKLVAQPAKHTFARPLGVSRPVEH